MVFFAGGGGGSFVDVVVLFFGWEGDGGGGLVVCCWVFWGCFCCDNANISTCAFQLFPYQERVYEDSDTLLGVLKRLSGAVEVSARVGRVHSPAQRRALQLCLNLARALQDVHVHNWLHCDLRAANILITNKGHQVYTKSVAVQFSSTIFLNLKINVRRVK